MSYPSRRPSLSNPERGSCCCDSSLVLVTTILLLMSCAVLSQSNQPSPSTNSFVARRFRDVNSGDKLWHDSSCFTQGLEFVDPTTMVESCGGYGRSRLQLLKLSDNKQTNSSSGGTTTVVVSVATKTDVAPSLFLEGLTVVDNRVFVLTWRSHQILEFSLPDLKHINTYPFPYDGWGLANHRTKIQSPDGAVVGDKPTDMFFATDGSHIIRKFSFNSTDGGRGVFTLVDSYEVICGNAGPVRNLNELEFVHPHYLFINIWMTGYIVVYDLSTNSCKRLVDVGTNVIGTGAGNGQAVMNGLAAFRDWEDGVCDGVECSPVRLFVTGKMWSDMYSVQINQL
eukprot:GHVS01069817.1.p1 GENE.GHVS01069817.1~~GHVS01069817.1.p1  ORF type:complete len:339 (+),score=62.67 GHVS01069817.1:385-1401(+)